MILHVVFLEEIVDENGQIPLGTQLSLRNVRSRGDMVLLVSNLSRTALMRQYYAHANVFLADGGLFGFGGCHCLWNNQTDAKLGLLQEVLDAHHLSYALQKEDDNSCGGRVVYAIADRTLADTPYLLVSETSDCVKTLQAELDGIFRVLEIDGKLVYVEDEKELDGAIAAIAQILQVSRVKRAI